MWILPRLGRPAGRALAAIGGHHFARPGQYTVEIATKATPRCAQAIAVTDAQNQSFKFKLARLPGVLEIRDTGRGPHQCRRQGGRRGSGRVRLPAGKHQLVIDAPRYLPFKATSTSKAWSGARPSTPQLVPAWAPVRVISEPAGAEVVVDGKAQGTTPAQLELDAGTHRVELRHPGFRNWVSDVQVVANQPQTLGPVRLGLPDGTLVVRTEPAGANVSVGGAFRGRTPVTLDVRPDVALALVAARDGYEPATTSLTWARVNGAKCNWLAAHLRRSHRGRGTGNGGGLRERPSRRQGGAGVPAARGAHRYRSAAGRVPTVSHGVTPRPGLPQVINVRLE